MAKFYILMGKSATGKDTVYRRVMDECGNQAKSIVTYTTRPKRDGEVDGRDYFFTTNEQVEEFQKNNKIIELRTYNTVHGPWHYYTMNDEQMDLSSDNKYVIINTLEAFNQYVRYFGRELIVPIYIEISESERIHRAMRREEEQEKPKYTEMCRRFVADEEDFSEEKLREAGIEAEDRYYNGNLEECVSKIAERILQG